jgi:dihydrofolate reductase
MAKLIYIINLSLDGYIEDASGGLEWANPQEVHAFITELLRPIGTYLYGRRVYETMAYWDAPLIEQYPPEHREFARVWQSAEKVVFSRTLAGITTRNTRLERNFEADVIREMKRGSKHDIAVAGAELAAVALEADLLDECRLFIHPAILGGGKPAFRTTARRNLELLEVRRFDSGVVYAHYAVPRR